MRPRPHAWRRPAATRFLALGCVARCAVLRDRHATVVERWVKEVVIGYNFCPYAQPAASRGHIRVVTSSAEAIGGHTL